MTLKQKNIWVSSLFMLVVALLLVAGCYALHQIQKKNDEVDARFQKYNDAVELRMIALNLSLTAIDSIVDRGEGIIQPERLAFLAEAEQKVSTALDHIDDDVTDDERQTITKLKGEFEKQIRYIKVDLRNAIETQADISVFEALDDRIDKETDVVVDMLGDYDTVVANKMDYASDQADRFVRLATIVAIAMLIGLIVVAMPAFIYIQVWIFNSIKAKASQLEHIAAGDLNEEITGTERHDEIGQLSRVAEMLKDYIVKGKNAEREKEESQKRAEIERKEMAQKLANDFEQRVQVIVQTIGSAATELSQSAAVLQDIVAKTQSKASSATNASTDTSMNVQTVASATEELSASVKEISQQVMMSNNLVRQSVEKTQQADSAAQMLDNTTSKISSIIDMINEIAGQINLLALNATIESARAGEAGRGFAVVASEVKNLASQTSKATEDITLQIQEMQNAAKDVVANLTNISQSIGEISHVTSGIASAVEEQSATTNDISRNLTQAAQGTNVITQDLREVNDVSTESKRAADQVHAAAEDLSKQSTQLSVELKKFLDEIRGVLIQL